MGLYFKKSINLGLFRINFSTSGVSISFGVRGARICFGPKGVQFNGGANGIYYSKKLSAKKSTEAKTPTKKKKAKM